MANKQGAFPIRKRSTAASAAPAAPKTNTNAKTSRGDQLRRRIALSRRDEDREHRMMRSQKQSHRALIKLYLAVIVNMILLLGGATFYWKPRVLLRLFQTSTSQEQQREKSATSNIPPRQLALLYPPNVSPSKDLPVAFGHYAIATPDNLDTRNAVRHVMAARRHLVETKIRVAPWDRSDLLQYPLDAYCGSGFRSTYNSNSMHHHHHPHHHSSDSASSSFLQDQLLHWCLLHTYQNDGYVGWNTTLHHPPQQQRNKDGAIQGVVGIFRRNPRRIHTGFIFLPKQPFVHNDTAANDTASIDHNGKLMKTTKQRNVKAMTYDMNTQVTARTLPFLLQLQQLQHHVSNSHVSLLQQLEEFLYHVIVGTESDRWLLLDVECTTAPSFRKEEDKIVNDPRIVATDCRLTGSTKEQECCVFTMPQRDQEKQDK